MPVVAFTPHLRRFLDVPEVSSEAAVLGAALEDAFTANPRLRGYVLDDQGHLRLHVAVFIDGLRAQDLTGLTDPVRPDSRVFVLQALTGG